MSNYLPIPPRVWSRVENPCVYNLLPNNVNKTYIPLTNQTVSLADANYEEQLLYKGNILQYKGNSAQLTKRQKYSQLAKGFGPNRRKVFATQSQTYSNPNTSCLVRVNSGEYPFPNQIVGAPNNIAGPYQYNVANPSGCPSNTLQDGGNLVCGTYANPCTGEIIKAPAKNAGIYNPSYCSDVPGAPIELYWNKKVQTWFPKQRLSMATSSDKWPEGYKGFVSAVSPTPPVISIYETSDYIQVSWALSNTCYPIGGFNIYINDKLYISIDNVPNNLYFYNIDKTLVEKFNKSLAMTKSSKRVFSTNINNNFKDFEIDKCDDCCGEYFTKLQIQSSIYATAWAGIKTKGTITRTESVRSNTLKFTTIKTISNSIDCAFFNDLFQNNAIVQINTYLKNYNDNINVNTGVLINTDTYTSVNSTLELFKAKFSPTCCFYDILTTYSSLWKSLWAAYNEKYYFYDLTANSASWHADSIILHDIDKLNDYLKKLQEGIYFTEVTVKSTLATIKPRYAAYHKLYGIPPNLAYDPEKMFAIDKELGLV